MWKLVLLILGLLYVLSPFDLLPDWLIGWGWLDDLVVLGFLARFVSQRLGLFNAANRETGSGSRSSQEQNSGGARYDENSGKRPTAAEPWNPHRILGLDDHASDLEIKQAYRRLANQYHPDKVAHLGREFRELAEIKFKEIQRAYQELK